jgi:hypothetical protein
MSGHSEATARSESPIDGSQPRFEKVHLPANDAGVPTGSTAQLTNRLRCVWSKLGFHSTSALLGQPSGVILVPGPPGWPGTPRARHPAAAGTRRCPPKQSRSRWSVGSHRPSGNRRVSFLKARRHVPRIIPKLHIGLARLTIQEDLDVRCSIDPVSVANQALVELAIGLSRKLIIEVDPPGTFVLCKADSAVVD